MARQEVRRQLSRWRPDGETLALSEYETSLLQGRAAVGVAFLVLLGMQALVLGLLVLQPLFEMVLEST